MSVYIVLKSDCLLFVTFGVFSNNFRGYPLVRGKGWQGGFRTVGGFWTVGGSGPAAARGAALVSTDALILVVAVLVLGLQAALQVVRPPRPDLALRDQAAQCP